MEKVKLTKEQAERLDHELSDEGKELIVKQHFHGWRDPMNECLNTLSLDEFIRALYIGFEVEETPEQRIKDVYKNLIKSERYYADQKMYSQERFYCGQSVGIRITLDILNIKVEGINK